VIRSWRIARAEDGRGLLVWFDPLLEDVSIRSLTGPERAARLTEPVSVSASENENDGQLSLDDHIKHKELNDGTS